jgi:hypothetical protein
VDILLVQCPGLTSQGAISGPRVFESTNMWMHDQWRALSNLSLHLYGGKLHLCLPHGMYLNLIIAGSLWSQGKSLSSVPPSSIVN